MKTAMQELRDDLVATLKTGDEALNEIQDISIRESCQKVVQLTLESIIKRIDEELLEMEKEQNEKYNELKEVIEDMIKHLDEGIHLTLRKDSIIVEALRNSINQ